MGRPSRGTDDEGCSWDKYRRSTWLKRSLFARRTTTRSSARSRLRPQPTWRRPSPREGRVEDTPAAVEARRDPRQGRPTPDRAPRRVRHDHRQGGGQADQDGPRRGRARRRHVPVRRRRGTQAVGGDDPARRDLGRRGQVGLHAARADRCRRRDRPVQLPAQPRRPQARPGHRRRVPGGAQAGQPDAVQLDRAGQDADRRVRPAGRVPARRHRRRRHGRQRDRRSPRHRPDHLHRLTRGRLGHPRPVPRASASASSSATTPR